MSSLQAFSQGKAFDVYNQPLEKILQQIENTYEIKFSYVDSILESKIISIQINPELPLANLLADLEIKTKLRFEHASEKYVIVRNFSDEDKIRICGYILDDKNRPVVSATIKIAGSNQGTTSDLFGYFSLADVPFNAILQIRHLGYLSGSKKPLELFSQQCPNIVLKERVEMLQNVTVSNYLTGGITKQNNLVQILPQELKILPGLIEPDILKSIQLNPGVNSPFETASGIHVRGGAPDQNLVLWNGIKTYNQGHFFGMLSAFNPYITNRVDFIKNGTGAQYGERVSSVIDIKTDDEVAQDFNGGAGFDMLYADAYLSVPVIRNKLSVLVAGRRSYSDLIETFTYQKYADRVFQNTKISSNEQNNSTSNNDFYFADLNSSVVFNPSSQHKILFNTLYAKNDLNYLTQNQSAVQSFNDVLQTENEGYNLKWMHKSKGKFSFAIDGYYAKYLLFYQFKNTTVDSTDLSSKKNLIRDFGANVNAFVEFSAKHQLKSGYQFSNNNVQYAFEQETPNYSLILDQANNEVSTHAFYSEYLFSNKKNTYLSAGLRYNYYQELNSHYVEPRLFFRQQLSDAFSLNTSAEYKSQLVSQIKESVVSDLSLENQVWTIASTDKFPVIDSYQYSLGASIEKKSWFFDIDSYYKQINNITTLTFGFLNPVDSEYRIGSSTILGFDFFLKKVFRQYKTWLSYSYLNSENSFVGLNNDESFPGNWNIEHTIKWSHFYSWKGLQLSLGWFWHTGKSFTDVVEEPAETGPVRIDYQALNGNNLPLYHRLDFSATYDFSGKRRGKVHYRIGLSILNVYNRKNLLNREFRTTPSLENELIDTRIYALGITPNLVFRIFW